jgi:histidine triad (HIT) family protein
MSDPNCIFCKIVAGAIPCKKVFENDHVLAFHDVAPHAPTHVLLIPKIHLASLNDASSDHQAVFGELLATVPNIAKELGIAESGYRTVINTGTDGGQTVFHLHVHILGGRPLAWPPG